MEGASMTPDSYYAEVAIASFPHGTICRSRSACVSCPAPRARKFRLGRTARTIQISKTAPMKPDPIGPAEVPAMPAPISRRSTLHGTARQ